MAAPAAARVAFALARTGPAAVLQGQPLCSGLDPRCAWRWARPTLLPGCLAALVPVTPSPSLSPASLPLCAL
eukprot:2047075-Prymnesium_polylepis.1